jgi:glyoxylase-like metal-dependent hydrolase (beta-lactamase superfamily II)
MPSDVARRIVAIAAFALWVASSAGAARAGEPAQSAPPVVALSEHLKVIAGPINVGVLADGERTLLIDCGDVAPSDARLGRVEQVLFTHHHRDQACSAFALAAAGAKLAVPAAERDYFDKPGDYWNNLKHRWGVYNFHPHRLMLAEPAPAARGLAEGDELTFGPAKIRVLHTPGHTDGSLSYLVEVDGRRFCFCGDAIYDRGQLWELYSLQKGTQTSDYHGFLGAREQLCGSLGKIKDARPDVLIPSHGRIMREPAAAMDELIERMRACYDKYVAISALRHYFPKLFADYAGRADHMPICPGKAPPDCLRQFGTTWTLISQDKAALVMDCGSPRVIEELKKYIEQGAVRTVEGLWITHYHNDHTEAIPLFQKAFDCPCITDESVAQIIANPLAWRLPCVSRNAARVDRPAKDGESWTWHEFKLTSYYLPGQSLYHAALLAERGELRMLFIGDSFTMAGIDDYCAQNRNWLGRGVGFDRSIALIEKLAPTHLFNPHVDLAFDFTPEQCRFMRENLAARERLYKDLFPWDHANYGMDEWWVRPHPYEQTVRAGGRAELRVMITNHSVERRVGKCRAVLPRAWDRTPPQAWTAAAIPPKTAGELRLAFDVPAAAPAGRYAIPLDVVYDDRTLPQFSEAVVVVEP